jgi:hypothetical protein
MNAERPTRQRFPSTGSNDVSNRRLDGIHAMLRDTSISVLQRLRVSAGTGKPPGATTATGTHIMPMTARCASATNPVAPGTASVIPPSRTRAAVPDETLGHAAVRERHIGQSNGQPGEVNTPNRQARHSAAGATCRAQAGNRARWLCWPRPGPKLRIFTHEHPGAQLLIGRRLRSCLSPRKHRRPGPGS